MNRPKKINSAMRVNYKAKYDLDKPCVAKVWFGEKYIIIKSADIKATMEDFKALFKKGAEPGEELVAFVSRRVTASEWQAKYPECVVEIMLASGRGEDLLAKEQALLNQRDKKNCLNRNTEPFRPGWIYPLMSERAAPAGFFRLKGRHRACPAVVKLWAGEKFFIWKCFNIQVFPDKFNVSIAENIRRYNAASGDRMNPLVAWIIQEQIEDGIIEVVFKASPKVPHWKWLVKFLAKEKSLLDKFVGKSMCLNKSVKQYKPQWIQDLQA